MLSLARSSYENMLYRDIRGLYYKLNYMTLSAVIPNVNCYLVETIDIC